ncbi:MAG TPA: hypothetical protein VNZ44_20905, partial [Pyrinomonadaceae bacterium]|nr:hypothetical protein [Pyrinomonadaceae bacterium]
MSYIEAPFMTVPGNAEKGLAYYQYRPGISVDNTTARGISSRFLLIPSARNQGRQPHLTLMPTTDAEKRLTVLKGIYQRMAFAYRRGDFEQAVHLSTKSSRRTNPLSIFTGDSSPTPFSKAAVKLFETAQELGAYYRDDRDVPPALKEQIAEHVLLAQTLAYEIMDYFLMTNPDVSEHFLKMAREVSRDVEGYYEKNYDFVVTERAKGEIVKQLVLGAL